MAVHAEIVQREHIIAAMEKLDVLAVSGCRNRFPSLTVSLIERPTQNQAERWLFSRSVEAPVLPTVSARGHLVEHLHSRWDLHARDDSKRRWIGAGLFLRISGLKSDCTVGTPRRRSWFSNRVHCRLCM